MLFLGAGNVLWAPLSNWLGRRPVLLAATLIMTLCMRYIEQRFPGRIPAAQRNSGMRTMLTTLFKGDRKANS